MSSAVDTLIVEIRAETRKLRKGLDEVNKKLAKTKKSTKGANQAFGKMKAALVAIGAGAVLGKVIEINRTFEDLEATLRAVTGSAEAASTSYELIRAFTATTTFQIEEVARSFIVLKQAGIVPTSDALMDFGNFAAGMGKSITQLAQAAFNATTGEMEMLKQFGIIARQQGDKITVTFDNVTKTIDRSGEAIVEYIRSIGREEFSTAIEERFNTLSGSISTVNDQLSELAVSVGDGVGGKGLRSEFVKLNKSVASLLETLRPLGQALGFIIGVLADLLAAIISIVDGVLVIITAIVDFTNWLGILKDTLSGNIRTFEDFKLSVRGGATDIEALDAKVQELLKTNANFKDGFSADEISDFKLFEKIRTEVFKTGKTIDDLLDNQMARLKQIIETGIEAKFRMTNFGPMNDVEARKRITRQMLGYDTVEEFLEATGVAYSKAIAGMDDLITASDQMKQAVADSAHAFTSSFVNGLLEGQDALDSFKDFAKSIVSEIITIFLRLEVVNAILNQIFPSLGLAQGGIITPAVPKKTVAGGGTIQGGRASLVGERGPEIFVPNTGGRIMNNMNSKNAMGGGGTTVINQSISFSTGLVPTVRAEVMKMLPQISEVTKGAVAEAAMRGGSYRRMLQGG